MSLHPEEHDVLRFIIHDGAPLPLRWNGWESTTHRLHREGWRFEADTRYDREYGVSRLRVAAVSPDKRVMLSGDIAFDGSHNFYDSPYYGKPWAENPDSVRFEEHYGGTFLRYLFQRGLELKQYTCRDTVHVMTAQEVSSFQQLSPVNIFEPTAVRNFRFIDLACFALEKREDTAAIYIPPASVDECLNTILRLQYPEQAEIKKKLILPETKPIIKAQVYSLVA